MVYSYDRAASDPSLVSKQLAEVLRGLPDFLKETTDYRAAVQRYLKGAHGLDGEGVEELTDPIAIEKLTALAKHLVEAEKLLNFLSTHKPP